MVKQSEQRIKALGEENEKKGKESAAAAPSSPNEVGKLKALLQQVNESKKLLIAREQEALLECSRHKARSLGLEKDLNRLEERLRQQEDHIERMREAEEKYSLLTAKVQELSMYESEYQRLKMDLETQRQNLQKTQSELDAAKEESSKLKAQLNESTERFRHQSAAMKATAAKAERFEKLHAELTKKYANMEPAEVAKLKENEGKLKAELAQVHAQLKEKSAKVESLQSASKALQARVAELANQVRTNEANMNTVKQEAEKKAKNLEEQLSMKVRLLNQEQGMRKLRDNRIKDLGEQMKKMEEQLREEEKKVKTAAATASAAAAEQQQAKAQTSSATQTAGVAVSSAQPTTSRVVRDKRNIELLQGSAKILQEYRIQLSKALVALKKSGEGSQPAAAAATGVGAQKRKHPEQDPEEGGGTAGGPSSKISRVEKQEQPGESGGSASSSSSSSSATEAAAATATTATTAPDGNSYMRMLSLLFLTTTYQQLLASVVISQWKDSRPTSSRISYTVQAGKLVKLEYGNATASGSIEEPTEEIARRFANVIPFASLMERIRHDFERGGMTDYVCKGLIEHVESSPYDNYKAGKDWIKEFVSDNMNTALNLLRQYGSYSDKGI
ncbi:hypothetical protein FOZ60_001042 [Perkinsus olseni]|uniref:Uncharacterized protein n=1 Tax=Perkinsus olseni TaxID=32597 RepID=A0A7J6P239_PEROL|nr:hypothetical protein FOZ60_001042 [Perkinsus olseni]